MQGVLREKLRKCEDKKKENICSNLQHEKCLGKLQQIKSKRRVKEKGEVFTNEREVKAMCDLIPNDIWNNIDSTFLEPTCGNGNFLVEILKRKLSQCNTEEQAIRAIKSIYGIDIMLDNVYESRKRMKDIFNARFDSDIDDILEHNIICGDSLQIQAMWELEENKGLKGKVEDVKD